MTSNVNVRLSPEELGYLTEVADDLDASLSEAVRSVIAAHRMWREIYEGSPDEKEIARRAVALERRSRVVQQVEDDAEELDQERRAS